MYDPVYLYLKGLPDYMIQDVRDINEIEETIDLTFKDKYIGDNCYVIPKDKYGATPYDILENGLKKISKK